MLYRANAATNADSLHLRQIAEARRLDPSRWEEIYRDSSVDPEIVLFRIRENEAKTADTERLTALSAPSKLGGGNSGRHAARWFLRVVNAAHVVSR